LNSTPTFARTDPRPSDDDDDDDDDDGDGTMTPLARAASRPTRAGAACARALVDAGASVTVACGASGCAPLHRAAACNADRVAEVRSIHWSPYDHVGVVNADP
jgi:hypothetical protein